MYARYKKLTTGSGEQTYKEATNKVQQEMKELYLIDFNQFYHGYSLTD